MDPFALLRGGLRFDRRRFGDAHDLFEKDGDGEQNIDEEGDYIRHMFSSKTDVNNGKRSHAREDEDDDSEEEEKEETDDVDEEGGNGGGKDDKVHVIKQFRKRHRIYLKGEEEDAMIAPIETFADLEKYHVNARTIHSLSSKYMNPTPIQMQGLPVMMEQHDIVAVAPTGSGKTFAFALPLLVTLAHAKLLQKEKDEQEQKEKKSKKTKKKSKKKKQKDEDVVAVGDITSSSCALIIAPTRELAHQTKIECDFLNKHIGLDVKELTKANVASFKAASGKFDVLIATPRRLVHALEEEYLTLDRVHWLVVDEADLLFENGYDSQLDTIITACHNRKHMGLFSATMPERVETLARSVLQNHIKIKVGAPNAAATSVQQRLVFTGDESGKSLAMTELIQNGLKPPVLLFVQSKSRAKELFQELVYENINVDVIHADRTPHQRAEVVEAFRKGEVWVLICTDLMGRGIDFKGVNLVINYDFPPSANDYIHRIGRTGRGGRKGEAVTFYTVRDAPMLRSIANVMKSSGCPVEDWMLELKKLKKHQRSRTITREAISSDVKTQQKDKDKRRKWAQKHQENKKKRAKQKNKE
eukprot:m.29807 g.29807  ORF g.29807 m.29807 type:complete len:585 (+) comp9601_c0_seq1:77-1831(+)